MPLDHIVSQPRFSDPHLAGSGPQIHYHCTNHLPRSEVQIDCLRGQTQGHAKLLTDSLSSFPNILLARPARLDYSGH